MSSFEYLEVVKILKDNYTKSEGIVDTFGVVQTEGSFYDGDYIFGVFIIEKEEVYMLKSYQMTSTGQILSEEEFYDGTSIHVKVDSKTGKGDIETN